MVHQALNYVGLSDHCQTKLPGPSIRAPVAKVPH